MNRGCESHHFLSAMTNEQLYPFPFVSLPSSNSYHLDLCIISSVLPSYFEITSLERGRRRIEKPVLRLGSLMEGFKGKAYPLSVRAYVWTDVVLR